MVNELYTLIPLTSNNPVFQLLSSSPNIYYSGSHKNISSLGWIIVSFNNWSEIYGSRDVIR